MATILIVDDRPGNRHALTTLLAYRRHRLLEASDGREALTLAGAEHPDLIISDILMPEMDGFEFVRRLRADRLIGATPVIFSTAHFLNREAAALAQAMGVSCILCKPIAPERLQAAIDAVLQAGETASPRVDNDTLDEGHLRLLTDKLAEKADLLRTTNGKLNALIELTLRLSSERDPHILLAAICRGAREIFAARYAVAGLVDIGLHTEQPLASSGMGAGAAKRLKLPDQNGALLAMLEDRKPRRIKAELGAEMNFAAAATCLLNNPPVNAQLSVPIASSARVYGWLYLGGKIGLDEFTEEDEQLASHLAALAGRIYENSATELTLRQTQDLLEQRVAERTADLALANDNLRLAYDQVQQDSIGLATARLAAEAANEAKSQFVATMTHELRTPLTGLIGFSDVLLRGNFEPQELRRFLVLQRDAALTLSALVDDILDLSKVEAGRLELEVVAFEPRAVVAGCEILVGHSIEAKGLTFHSVIEASVPQWLAGDPTRLRQVILNLLTNAVKFTGTGSIALTTRMAGVDGTRLRIGVRDTGIGIPADKLGRLFLPFSQVDASTNRRFGGSGLGLAICRRLVELMGGEIGVESAEGRGSEFWFEVPLAGAAAPEPAVPADAAFTAGAPRRVLLAEDNPTNQVLVSAVLEMAGHRVEIVDNGAAAVQAAATGAFDLILMDLRMPVMDGLEATRRIRATEMDDRHVPIVALTANATSSDVEHCRAAGMSDFLAKPIDMDLLLATVTRLGDGTS